MRKTIVGIVAAAVLFVGGSAAQEFLYCTGYAQGSIDIFGATWGPPPPNWSPDDVSATCAAAPNDPYGFGKAGIPRFFVGNWFDKAVDTVKDLL